MLMKITMALVQGDAAGIGAELLSKLLDDEQVRERANLLIVSDERVFRAGYEVTGLTPSVRVISQVGEMDFGDGLPNLLNMPVIDPRDAPLGKVSVAAGGAVLQCFGKALELAQSGVVDGVCFMPFNKAALNPHAGDGGQIGREEIDTIAPAVERARERQIHVDGPFPSDTLYIKVRDKQYDCAVSMYHDQGQIAIKLLGFHMGVTVLGGLPFPVATPARGTAFDIAGTNSARVEPARRAFMMACNMAENRKNVAA